MKITRILLTAALAVLSSCSSAPKRPAEVFTERNMAANQLDLANATANQGRYEDALLILEDAARIAVSVDDPPLIIKASIARGNFLFSLGRQAEAFAAWEAARLEAETAGLAELASLAGLYAVRGRLTRLTLEGIPPETAKTLPEAVSEIRDEAESLTAVIKTDDISRAAGLIVLAMAEKELGRYAEAEAACREALAIHEKNRYLEEAAYDWYFLASIYSVGGRYEEALAALDASLALDRRAENSYGLASTWQARGEVYLKMNLRPEAAKAFRRSAAIFRAAGLTALAEKAAAKAASIETDASIDTP